MITAGADTCRVLIFVMLILVCTCSSEPATLPGAPFASGLCHPKLCSTQLALLMNLRRCRTQILSIGVCFQLLREPDAL